MQLGPYRLVSRIGAGGMGEVWLAEDTRLLRPVAVKVLSHPVPKVEETTQVVCRALIADEDEATRACLRDVLAATGIICDEADNGTDAVHLLRDRVYALAFIDLFLPRIDGWGVLDYARWHQLSERMRIFAVTSGKPPRFSRVDRETITNVLCKPLDAERVERAIAEAATSTRRSLVEV